ncbi:unnamed protein product, partial [Chrysoparadoxa australica]
EGRLVYLGYASPSPWQRHIFLLREGMAAYTSPADDAAHHSASLVITSLGGAIHNAYALTPGERDREAYLRKALYKQLGGKIVTSEVDDRPAEETGYERAGTRQMSGSTFRRKTRGSIGARARERDNASCSGSSIVCSIGGKGLRRAVECFPGCWVNGATGQRQHVTHTPRIAAYGHQRRGMGAWPREEPRLESYEELLMQRQAQ